MFFETIRDSRPTVKRPFIDRSARAGHGSSLVESRLASGLLQSVHHRPDLVERMFVGRSSRSLMAGDF
jgi:hypothetical protein